MFISSCVTELNNIYIYIYKAQIVELAWRSGSVMDCHATARSSNDLAVDGT